MVKAFMFLAGLCAAACTNPSFREPIKPSSHGAAVRANMAAHIIDPTPPARKTTLVDAHRAVLATEKYRTGEVEAPGEKKAPSLTGAEE